MESADETNSTLWNSSSATRLNYNSKQTLQKVQAKSKITKKQQDKATGQQELSRE
jgi:hypothetical protein